MNAPPTAPSPFEPVDARASFPELEETTLELWQRLDAFEESNRRRASGRPFVFYDGPPFATGTPHYGHLLTGTIKDVVPRYWNMRGHPVERRFGWDCHGLPIEALAQEALGLTGTSEILAHGVGAFNDQCRRMVQTYVAEWRKTVTRMGRWIDFDRAYKTMDTPYMESVWWVFKQLWEAGRVYKSYRIMPYSPALSTPLSNFEANSNYKTVQDPAITVRFRARGGKTPFGVAGETSLLAWTTTPWTLPSNLALCVGPDIDYACVETQSGERVVIAEARLAAYEKASGSLRVVARGKGRELVGLEYEPLFPYFAKHERSFVVLADDFVSTDDGTGIVHLAPAYGEDDFRVCRAAGIELVDPLDAEARFEPVASDFAGQACKAADPDIIRHLKSAGLLFRQSTIQHSYPYEDRTDTPLIYRAIDAWYVQVANMREELVERNRGIRWIPEFVGSKRFGNWLGDANDWNVSRNRFWGSCIPVWVSESDPEDRICVGSIAELEQLSGVRVDDLHKHVVDEVIIEKDGKRYRRTPEVLDCWFESGSMPYAQHHFPFEREGELDALFPAQFIAEGLDQTRGWFYTLLVLGTSLLDRAPYENVIVNGMILAEDGQKMSKRRKNYPEPNEVLDRYGADALRAYLIDSPVVRGEPLRFSERGLEQIVRTVVLPFWNALSFFCTYARVDGYDPRAKAAPALAERPDVDRWVVSVLQSLVADVNREMQAYRLYAVVPRLVRFIDDLTNWYVRRSRPRFWKSDDDEDKSCAYATLYEVLVTFSKVLAPFMPFVTEAAYQRLVRPVEASAPESVHFCDYPEAKPDHVDGTLEARMATARQVVALGRKLREEHRIRVRQPLERLSVVHRSEATRDAALASAALIRDELNVKSVDALADESSFTKLTVKPNFKALGKRCGPKLKGIAKALLSWGFDEVARLEADEPIEVEGEALSLGDVILQRSARDGAAVATNGQLSVVLDTDINDELRREGIARDFVNLLQNARKDAGLNVSDRIRVSWSSDDPEVARACRDHAPSICREVLAVHFAEGATHETSALGERSVGFSLTKA